MRRQLALVVEAVVILVVSFGSLALVARDGSVSLADWLVVGGAIAVVALLQRALRHVLRR